jgi:hypothetical protein
MNTVTQRLHALATKRFPTLTPAEERLLYEVAEEPHYGFPLIAEAEYDLRQADTWGPERTIHAEVLRWLCVDRDAIRHVDPKGVFIQGARIDGTLDLQNVTVPFPLFLVRCAIREPVKLAGAEVRLLGIEGSTSESIHGDGMVVHRGLWLRNGFCAKGEVRLRNVTIVGHLDCRGGRFLNAGGMALDASGAKIGNMVLLGEGFHAEGMIRLASATIGGHLIGSWGAFHQAGGTVLDASGAKIDGSVFLDQGFQAEGEVSLIGATIAGRLSCSGGAFHQAGGMALDASETKIDGSVFLGQGFQAEGLVAFSGAHIQGTLDCKGGFFSGDALNGLIGEAMVVGGLFDCGR